MYIFVFLCFMGFQYSSEAPERHDQIKHGNNKTRRCEVKHDFQKLELRDIQRANEEQRCHRKGSSASTNAVTCLRCGSVISSRCRNYPLANVKVKYTNRIKTEQQHEFKPSKSCEDLEGRMASLYPQKCTDCTNTKA